MPHFPPIGPVCNRAYRAGSAPALSNKKRKASISEQRAQANGHLCPYPNQLWFRCFRLQFFYALFAVECAFSNGDLSRLRLPTTRLARLPRAAFSGSSPFFAKPDTPPPRYCRVAVR